MKRRTRILAAALIVLAAAGAGLWLRGHAFSLVRVAGGSMERTLRNGDLALVTRADFASDPPRRGDVVQCRFPGRPGAYIKRVIGLPGDRVAFSGGRLWLNGVRTEEPYVLTPTDDYAIELGEDEYLVLGDNRAESYDSRMDDMGPLGRADLLGRVRWILLPLDRFGPIQQ